LSDRFSHQHAIVRTVNKRRVMLMIVCLVLGAVVNIAVAWSCAIWSRPNPADAIALPVGLSADIWNRIAPEAWQQEVDEVDQQPNFSSGGGRQESFGIEIDTVSYAVQGRRLNGGVNDWRLRVWTVFEVRTGWPLRTTRAFGADSSDDGKLATALAVVTPVNIDWISLNRGQVLPCGPLWPGLLANTIFYAAIVWLIIRGPLEIRRRWWQFRGCCQACGYPIGSSPVCTECGVPVPPGMLSPVESKAHQQRPIPHSPVAPSQTEDRSRD
jgi:hypothetical protein